MVTASEVSTNGDFLHGEYQLEENFRKANDDFTCWANPRDTNLAENIFAVNPS